MLDLTADIIAYEEGSMPYHEVPNFFEKLITSGLIRYLQGSYQRTALALVEAGEITLPQRAR